MDAREIDSIRRQVAERKPLVHHITNWVTIYDCANVVRSFGALPVMAHAPEEVEEMAGISSALVLNIGTLTSELISSMILAGKKANAKGIPVVLDAVGAGATKFRTEKTNELLANVHIDILKGNAGEIANVAGVKAEVRGVESGKVEGDKVSMAKALAKRIGAVVVITGKEDIVADSSGEAYLIKNGHAMMGSIVGTGCMVTSVIGAFAGVEKNYAKAACAALSCFGIAGELAAKKSHGPGSFKGNFYDEIANLDEKKILANAKVEEA